MNERGLPIICQAFNDVVAICRNNGLSGLELLPEVAGCIRYVVDGEGVYMLPKGAPWGALPHTTPPSSFVPSEDDIDECIECGLLPSLAEALQYVWRADSCGHQRATSQWNASD